MTAPPPTPTTSATLKDRTLGTVKDTDLGKTLTLRTDDRAGVIITGRLDGVTPVGDRVELTLSIPRGRTGPGRVTLTTLPLTADTACWIGGES